MADEREPGVIAHDSDVKAMNAISKAMSKLVGDEREAVIDWFHRKYPAGGQAAGQGK